VRPATTFVASDARLVFIMHRHLHHLVRMGVVHEGAALRELEFVDERLAGLDVRLGEAADAIPCRSAGSCRASGRRMLGQLVGDEDAHLVASTASIVGPGAWPL